MCADHLDPVSTVGSYVHASCFRALEIAAALGMRPEGTGRFEPSGESGLVISVWS